MSKIQTQKHQSNKFYLKRLQKNSMLIQSEKHYDSITYLLSKARPVVPAWSKDKILTPRESTGPKIHINITKSLKAQCKVPVV